MITGAHVLQLIVLIWWSIGNPNVFDTDDATVIEVAIEDERGGEGAVGAKRRRYDRKRESLSIGDVVRASKGNFAAAVIELGAGLHEVDPMNITENTIIRGQGEGVTTLRLTGNSNEPLITVRGAAFLTLEDITIDGNGVNQEAWTATVDIDGLGATIHRCSFIRTKKSAIRAKVEQKLRVDGNTFSELACHTGIQGESGNAIEINSENGRVMITHNSFLGSSKKEECNGSGGILVYSGSNCSVLVSGNSFERIGVNHAGNLVGNIDLYTNGSESRVVDNVFYDYRYTPLKLQNASNLVCRGNIIKSRWTAGGATGNACINVQAKTRDYPEAGKNVIVSENIIEADERYGIIVQGGEEDLIENVIVSNNLISQVDIGIGIISAANAHISGNMINHFTTRGITLREKCNRIKLLNNTLESQSGNASGIVIREGALQTDGEIRGNSISVAGSYSISIRDANFFKVSGNVGEAPIDTRNVEIRE